VTTHSDQHHRQTVSMDLCAGRPGTSPGAQRRKTPKTLSPIRPLLASDVGAGVISRRHSSKIRLTPAITDSSTIQVSYTPGGGVRGVPGLRRQGLQKSKTRAFTVTV